MKKAFSLIIAAAMLLSLCLPAGALSFSPAERSNDPSTYFTVGNATGFSGGEVTVPVTISGDFHCHGLNLHVYYDVSKLNVANVTGGDLYASRPNDALVGINYTANSGDIRVGGICPRDAWEGEGVLIYITFRISEDCDTDQPVSIDLREYYLYPMYGDKTDLLPTAVLQDGTVFVSYEEYTVTFRDWDGSVLKTETVPYGGSATPPPVPSRYGYTFTGWDLPFNCITSDLIITAQYSINTYTVRFRDWNGTILKTETVEHGSAAVPPSDPTRYGYTFTGWDVPFDNVVSNLTVTAQYVINTYTVTFVGAYSGSVQAEHGSSVELPVLASDSMHYVFTLNGEPWYGTNVVSDLIIVVDIAVNVYTVTFRDTVDGSVLKAEEVTQGSSASAPEAPQHYGYTFKGWDSAFSSVTCDMTVNTVFEPVKFTVIFMDGFDNVICVLLVPYLSSASAPAIPEFEGWEFTGWDQDFSCVEHDMVINATWNRICFIVKFTGAYNGVEIVEYGEDCPLPVYNSETIHYTFTVNGEPWDGKNIRQNYTVLVGAALNAESFFTVTFVDPDGNVLKEEVVMYGCAATAPNPPSIHNMVFCRWDSDFSFVTADMTVTAEYLLLGDVDFSGTVDTTDALLTLRTALKIIHSFSAEQLLAADFDFNDKIDTTDALLILRLALHINSNLQ